jgi:carbon storage regulator
MLVLSRYRDESIYIGDDIVITVVDIRGDRVRIGVQAPPDVTVHRQEIYEAIKNGGPREMDSGTHKVKPSVPKPVVPPLSQELSKRKTKLSEEAKGLPVAIDSPVEFGGLTSSDSAILPQ